MFQSLTVVHFILIQLAAKWLIVDQSLTAGVIPINLQQQRALLPFKPCVLEMKVYNNDDITFFSVLTFVMRSCDNMLQPSLDLAKVYTWKRMFCPLIVCIDGSLVYKWLSFLRSELKNGINSLKT